MAANAEQRSVIISPQAKDDILNIFNYLKENWGQKFVDEFLQKLESFYDILLINPRLFGYYNKRVKIRKYIITKQNIIYYRINKNVPEVITVFDIRQNPEKLKKVLKKR
ncbi:MAG: type II toxin-antitoxin system RelE/ParE family toxin [Bacteroidota bacterium]|nr:type II toxin-antitoxin system RelE/ParE family toxin [Bacteroidota bacterium]